MKVIIIEDGAGATGGRTNAIVIIDAPAEFAQAVEDARKRAEQAFGKDGRTYAVYRLEKIGAFTGQ